MPKVLYPFYFENLGIYWVDLKEIWAVYKYIYKLIRFSSRIPENISLYTEM